MGKILFTENQIKKLSKNKWIKNITTNSITYTEEFKTKLVIDTAEYKKFPRDVFEECGIDPKIIGIKRIENVAYRARKTMMEKGEIINAKKGNSGRKLKRELSDKEKLERAEAKIKLLEAENELLKKNELIEMGILKDIKSITNLK